MENRRANVGIISFVVWGFVLVLVLVIFAFFFIGVSQNRIASVQVADGAVDWEMGWVAATIGDRPISNMSLRAFLSEEELSPEQDAVLVEFLDTFYYKTLPDASPKEHDLLFLFHGDALLYCLDDSYQQKEELPGFCIGDGGALRGSALRDNYEVLIRTANDPLSKLLQKSATRKDFLQELENMHRPYGSFAYVVFATQGEPYILGVASTS